MEREISSSLEDYLEAIAELVETEGHAHSKAIAERLKVTRPSVTNALQALAIRGLIEYQSHTPVVLTPKGAERAAVICRRHRLLKQFFSEILKLSDDESNDAACKIEHVIGETVLSRFLLLASAVRERQDCNELRAFLEEKMPKIHTDPDAELISLSELSNGKTAVIVHVADNLRGIRKFADLGLVSGTMLQFEGRAPLGDLMRFKVMGSTLSMRSSDAAHILVKIVE